jgi:putative ABC transport system ATP-binding protein
MSVDASNLDRAGPIVAARDLRRRYGEGEAAIDALDGVSVEFPRGRFAAIMGPSGSGKSTLMHNLAGLDRPTSGTVSVDGVELTGLDDRRLTKLRRDRIGFIFQTFNLLPVLSAEENILLPLSIAGAKPDRRWYEQLIDTVAIRDRLGHRPAEMSGGQQQRVAVARALVSRPRSCSPTSRRATSTRNPPVTCLPCCVRPSTISARRS